MRKKSEDHNGLWYRVSREERERLVTLGGLFNKQKELAKLLETTPGRLARFRQDNDIYMPVEKLDRSDKRFVEFTELLKKLSPPAVPFIEDPQKDLEAGYFLSNLIVKKMEEERTIPRWGKCWWPTVPKPGGGPVRYLCEEGGSPLCDDHQRELGSRPLILHLSSPYPLKRSSAVD